MLELIWLVSIMVSEVFTSISTSIPLGFIMVTLVK